MNRRSRSRERERKRRSRSRERDRGRDRDRPRDRDRRDRDRYDSKSGKVDRSRGGGGYDAYSEKLNAFEGGDAAGSYGSSRRSRRSRSRERKRYARSRSRSPSRERKRSRNYEHGNDSGLNEKDRHSGYYDAGAESGELEEGEEQTFDAEYRQTHSGDNNGYGKAKHSEEYSEYQNSYSQPAYVAYNANSD